MHILITGGASGLGHSMTRTLALRFPEARISFTYNNSGDAAAALEAAFPNCRGLHCDFSDLLSVAALADLIAAGDIDILINNAIAMFRTGYAHKLGSDAVLESFRVNVAPVLTLTHAFITVSRKRRSGRIITILSTAMDAAAAGWSVYGAEKLYLLGMHQAWAKENAAFGITSNCISPGFMPTAFHSDMDERLIEDLQNRHPLKKLLDPEDVAELASYLCTASLQINGQNYRIG